VLNLAAAKSASNRHQILIREQIGVLQALLHSLSKNCRLECLILVGNRQGREQFSGVVWSRENEKEEEEERGGRRKKAGAS